MLLVFEKVREAQGGGGIECELLLDRFEIAAENVGPGGLADPAGL